VYLFAALAAGDPMLTKSAIVFVLFGSLLTFAGAQTKKAAPAVSCPVCHMALAAKKSKSNPTAVRLTKKDKVMYCCAGCKMPASVLVKSKK
jgi:hypothetical protein